MGRQGKQLFLCWVRSEELDMRRLFVVHVLGHTHAPAHAHVAVTACLPKKTGVYLDSSALLIKKPLISRDNKSLAP